MLKRSVRIAHHNTSISLEPEFWEELKVIALRRRSTLNKLIESVDKKRGPNLSSALRLFVLEDLKSRLRLTE